jgi:hypothetical protein
MRKFTTHVVVGAIVAGATGAAAQQVEIDKTLQRVLARQSCCPTCGEARMLKLVPKPAAATTRF